VPEPAGNYEFLARSARAAYADMFGPTVGDKVRPPDTELFIEVEADRTFYGEEVKFGGGKVVRDGMGHRGAAPVCSPDLVSGGRRGHLRGGFRPAGPAPVPDVARG
jgi:hypothetical protein